MALLMVLDHIRYIPDLLPPLVSGIFHMLTRCVAVWFAFMAVEGFLHTHSRVKYNLRLLLWAIIMAVGNTLLNLYFQHYAISIHNNIFLTLAVGVLLLNILFYEDDNNLVLVLPPKRGWTYFIRILLAIVVGFVGMLMTEGGILIIPFMLITYVFRNMHFIRNILYLSMSVFLLFPSAILYPDEFALTLIMFLQNSEWAFITVVPFMYLYNGQRGPDTIVNRYFFYVFYPAHLWLITFIAYLIEKSAG